MLGVRLLSALGGLYSLTAPLTQCGAVNPLVKGGRLVSAANERGDFGQASGSPCHCQAVLRVLIMMVALQTKQVRSARLSKIPPRDCVASAPFDKVLHRFAGKGSGICQIGLPCWANNGLTRGSRNTSLLSSPRRRGSILLEAVKMDSRLRGNDAGDRKQSGILKAMLGKC